MLFNSFPFLFLVLATLALYYLPALRRYQVQVLILSSFTFYAYGQPYLLLLLVLSATITSGCSYRVLHASVHKRQVLWAVSGVVVNLLVLAFFKYNKLIASAMYEDLAAIDGAGHFLLTLALPVGISFYTFQGISLIVDVFKIGVLDGEGAAKPRIGFGHHLKNTLLYITFFPQLVAGPIVRAHHFYPQIQPKAYASIKWNFAIKCMITGYFLKTVIADNMQDQTFWITYPYFLNKSSIDLVVLLFGYSMQIFSDFAGYSLIAIGVAALYGYSLPVNFNFPYISQSVSEFWRRWHISLSTWLREYLYIPLGGNKKGSARLYVNLMIVMFLGGLWHGAAWSYAVWGSWHGVALSLERPFRHTWFFANQSWGMKLVRITLVFLFVTLSWLLFKLPDFSHVVQYIHSIFTNTDIGPNLPVLMMIFIYSFPVVAYHAIHVLKENGKWNLPGMTGVFYGAMLSLIVLNGGNSNAFIYFQF